MIKEQPTRLRVLTYHFIPLSNPDSPMNRRVQLIFCKDSANERKENVFSICRVQFILCKDSANWLIKQIFSRKLNKIRYLCNKIAF